MRDLRAAKDTERLHNVQVQRASALPHAKMIRRRSLTQERQEILEICCRIRVPDADEKQRKTQLGYGKLIEETSNKQHQVSLCVFRVSLSKRESKRTPRTLTPFPKRKKSVKATNENPAYRLPTNEFSNSTPFIRRLMMQVFCLQGPIKATWLLHSSRASRNLQLSSKRAWDDGRGRCPACW